MQEYNKLVRDLIPQIVEKEGKRFSFHWASGEELTKRLEDKLQEEVNEYLESKELEELADVLEVLVGLASNLGYTEEDLFKKRAEKKQERGGFSEGIVLESTWE